MLPVRGWRALGAREWDYRGQGIRDPGQEQIIHHSRWTSSSKQHLLYAHPRVFLLDRNVPIMHVAYSCPKDGSFV